MIITSALQPLAPLWPFLRPQWRRVVAAEIAGLAGTLADAGLIVLLARFLEAAHAGRDPAAYAAAVGLVVVRVAAARAQGAWHGAAAAAVRARLAVALHDRLLRLPLAALRSAPPGDLLARVFHDAPLAASFALQGAPQALLQASRAAVLLLAAAAFHPATAGLVLAVAPLLLLVARAHGRRAAALHVDLASQHGAMFQTAEDALGAPEVLRAYRAAESESRRFEALAAGLARAETQVSRVLANADPAAGGLAALLVIALVWQGQAEVATGRVSVPALAAAAAAAGAALAALRGLVGLHSQAQEGLVAARRVAELLAAPLEPAAGSAAVAAPFADTITFEDVGFAYPRRGLVLRGVTFTLRRGERVALVGETGGGKTTLLRLLLRLAEPTSGRLAVDGIDAATLPLHAWRALFGLVPQDAQLLARSLAENVRLGRDGADDDAVATAVAAAGLDALVTRMPAGLDTGVGAAGKELSGGERLEVALARALLAGAEVLVLDEVTAALDAISEQRALAAIRGASERRTLLLVTHRLSTARLADRVLVLDGGRIVEAGGFDELLARGGALRRMWEAQGRPGA